MIRQLILIWVVLGLSVVSASGQTCAGYGSFDDGSGLWTAGGVLGPDAYTVGTTLSGRTNGLIGGGGFRSTKDENLDIWSSAVSGSLGTEVRVGESVFICPAGQVDYTLPFTVAGTKVSRFGVGAGARLGVRIGAGRNIGFVPTAGTLVLHQRQYTDDLNVSETGGAFVAGVGIVFSRRYAVVPLVIAPFGFADATPQFSIQLGINFGR